MTWWLAPLGGGVLVAAFTGWAWWDSHVRHGPLVPGNARWRREAPLRAARQADREALAALTDTDRMWLQAMGWQEPSPPSPLAAFGIRGVVAFPTIACIDAPTTAELAAGVVKRRP